MFDKIKSIALEGFLKTRFSDYLEEGDVSVDLNTAEATCIFKARLAGENEHTTVEVRKFEVVGEGDKRLVIRDVYCDKKWVNNALKDHLVGKEIRLPSFMASAL